MKYVVIEAFTDLQDNDWQYGVGDEFPHTDANISQARIEELATAKNLRGIPLIKSMEAETEKPRKNTRKKNAIRNLS